MNRLLLRASAVALTLAVAATPLAAQSAAAQPTNQRPSMDPAKLKSILINVPTGSPLRIRTRDGVEVAGKLTQLTNDGVDIQALTGGNIENRTVKFSDIAGLAAGPKKSMMARTLGPVLAIASLAGTIGAITAAIKK